MSCLMIFLLLLFPGFLGLFVLLDPPFYSITRDSLVNSRYRLLGDLSVSGSIGRYEIQAAGCCYGRRPHICRIYKIYSTVKLLAYNCKGLFTRKVFWLVPVFHIVFVQHCVNANGVKNGHNGPVTHSHCQQ